MILIKALKAIKSILTFKAISLDIKLENRPV